MNKIFLMGWLSNIEYHENKEKLSCYTTFLLKVKSPFGKEKRYDKIPCVCYGKTAKVFADKLTEESKSSIFGRLKANEDNTFIIVVDEYEFI